LAALTNIQVSNLTLKERRKFPRRIPVTTTTSDLEMVSPVHGGTAFVLYGKSDYGGYEYKVVQEQASLLRNSMVQMFI
jgi:hypothetical protein